MTVIKKNNRRTISTRKGTLVVRTKKEKKSEFQKAMDEQRRSFKKAMQG